jgi:hypothetical protein
MVVAVLLCGVAHATIDFTASGTSAKGVDVTFKALLTLSGDDLTVVLINDSPVDSLNPDDILGSFYFDIVNDSGVRPVLTYERAVGDTYKGSKKGPDTLIEAGADLQVSQIDGGWQFRGDLDVAQNPFLGFGIGTVGNSNLSPNGFDGALVSPVDFAIYTGEITTQPLVNPNALVKDMATFTFKGLTGFTEADIAAEFAFGLGTAPDSLLTPEPATMCLLGLGGLMLRKRR